jgi:hypothetical protein
MSSKSPKWGRTMGKTPISPLKPSFVDEIEKIDQNPERKPPEKTYI